MSGLNPRICPIAIDANALNRDGVRDVLVERLIALSVNEEINLIMPKGVRSEIHDLRTPSEVRVSAPAIFSIGVSLNSSEVAAKKKIEALMQGHAQPGKHAADADHIFEAGKYAGYFITEDARILSKRGEIARLVPNQLRIVTLEEFLLVYDETAES